MNEHINKHDAIIRAESYKQAMEKAIKIIDKVDMEHPEYPMPMELWARLRKEIGDAETYLYEVEHE